MDILLGHQLYPYLQDGFVFTSMREPRIIIKWQHLHVVCLHEQWTVRLSWEDFLATFAHIEFHVTCTNTSMIDGEKDHQFYSWKQ